MKLRFYILVVIGLIFSGCSTVTYRSDEKIQEPVINLEKKSTAIIFADDFISEEQRKFFFQTVPLKSAIDPDAKERRSLWGQPAPEKFSDLDKITPDLKNKSNYRLRVILTRDIHHKVVSWLAILTLGVLPVYEAYTFSLAAKLENLKTGKEKKYLYSGRIDSWWSSLPIFLQYVLRPDGPSDDLAKSLILKLNEEMAGDLKNEKI